MLFVDVVHVCFSFLNRALELDMAPALVIATYRGIAKIPGARYRIPHSIPLDLLDRLMILSTEPCTQDEVRKILSLRCN